MDRGPTKCEFLNDTQSVSSFIDKATNVYRGRNNFFTMFGAVLENVFPRSMG